MQKIWNVLKKIFFIAISDGYILAQTTTIQNKIEKREKETLHYENPLRKFKIQKYVMHRYTQSPFKSSDYVIDGS